MTTNRLVGVLTAVTVLILAGCGGGDPPRKKDPPLQTMKQADAEQLIRSFADAVAQTVSSPLEHWKTIPTPCDNAAGITAVDGPWSISGFANLAVKPADQVTTLTRLRDHWKQQGYEITDFRTFPPDNTEGTVSARVPASMVTISVASAGPGTSVALIVATPCYEPAPGEHPGN